MCNSWFSLTQKLWCQARVSEIFWRPGFECGIGKRPNSPTWVCCYLDRLKWRWLDQVPSLPATKIFKLLQYNTDPVHHNDWGWKCPLEEEVSHPPLPFSQQWHSALGVQCSRERDFCLSEYLSNEVYYHHCSWEPGNCFQPTRCCNIEISKSEQLSSYVGWKV